MRKTNPLCIRPQESVGQAPPYKGAQLRQTNPIPGTAGRRPGNERRKTNPIGRSESCETNPISGRGRVGRGLGDAGRGVLYKQTQFLPLCRSGDRRSREGKRAKQTQSAADRQGHRRGQACKTNPIRLLRRGVWGKTPPYERAQLRQTNPIQPARPASRVPGRGEHAKRSQFSQGGRRPRRQRAKMCGTNPIWAGGAGTGATERAKRTQLLHCGFRISDSRQTRAGTPAAACRPEPGRPIAQMGYSLD